MMLSKRTHTAPTSAQATTSPMKNNPTWTPTRPGVISTVCLVGTLRLPDAASEPSGTSRRASTPRKSPWSDTQIVMAGDGGGGDTNGPEEELPAPTYDYAYYAALPRKRVGAGALITDASNSILVVEPVYKERWEVPGGIVEDGETAHAACVRECREELGLEIAVGRLLVIEHQTGLGERGDSIMMIYDGGVLGPEDQVRLPVDELRSYSYMPADELTSRMGFRLANRLRLALAARSAGTTVELENGVPRGL